MRNLEKGDKMSGINWNELDKMPHPGPGSGPHRRVKRLTGQGKSWKELDDETDKQLFDNLRKCMQILDCGQENPPEYIDKLWKEGERREVGGGAKAIWRKLCERHENTMNQPRIWKLRERLDKRHWQQKQEISERKKKRELALQNHPRS